MISENKYIEIAKRLHVEVAVLKAVAEVESNGSGFLGDGQVSILFEPHIWWRQLQKYGKDPNQILKQNPQLKTILYPKWGTYPYGKMSAQHPRLQKAVSIHRESALESASWGAFQVLGKNWRDLGFNSIQEFINVAYSGIDGHFELFVRFVEANNLTRYLQTKQWAKFALLYNGVGYKKNRYDVKLQLAYEKYSK